MFRNIRKITEMRLEDIYNRTMLKEFCMRTALCSETFV